MRLKLYWLQKLRAFRIKGSHKRTKSITAPSDHNVGNAHSKSTTKPRFKPTSTNTVKQRPSKKFAQVVASLGCGSTVSLRVRKERREPKVYSEEEDTYEAPPLATFGGCSKVLDQDRDLKLHYLQHDQANFIKKGSLDQHTSPKRWVGACRCIRDVSAGIDKRPRPDEGLKNSSRKLKKELTSYAAVKVDMEAKSLLSREQKAEMTSSDSMTPELSNRKKVTDFKQANNSRTLGSMSERIVVDKTRVNVEALISKRWSSASVRDCLTFIEATTPIEPKPNRSSVSVYGSKESPLANVYNYCLPSISFDRWQQSMTSISTLSSFDLDRVSNWGSYDITNGPYSLRKGAVQRRGDMDEDNLRQSIRRQSQKTAFSSHNRSISVMAYDTRRGMRDDEDDDEACGLLLTDSCARTWLDRDAFVDGEDDYYDNDLEYVDDCLIDLEANAKAWANAGVLSSSVRLDGGSSSCAKHHDASASAQSHLRLGPKSQRELDAAALKRKYRKEFAGKHQTVVVASHYGDNMNTFIFPPMSDQEDDEVWSDPIHLIEYSTTKSSKMVSYEEENHGGFKHLVSDECKDYRSLAIEQKSRNPYADFRDSMVEMVLQNKMHKSSELEELLQSFLSLNSLEHHGLIVQAFSEVWEKVFGSMNGFHKGH